MWAVFCLPARDAEGPGASAVAGADDGGSQSPRDEERCRAKGQARGQGTRDGRREGKGLLATGPASEKPALKLRSWVTI